MASEVGETISFESSALNGLRGFAAIHILIFHSVIYSSWGFQIYGAVSQLLLISFFFHLIGKFDKKTTNREFLFMNIST